ncbi:hypothetical protein CONCODRAFT_68003 [Conidiobolus coronatus NRRL 28638]|uniref:Replication factor A C-terminal domain-containing protein n=1 Tax=Conidiobolus coronatus (strain ATCC 28846 / CBS 209.66 / NRRL 28638) TaxID=796925 RepID=A0A137PFL1_CONC2|nr:hypothetical protein CONCODRAFT_68003 [Conidiobolus coronatus NRRL 28638]|eukprot:KXN73784.1 hypothetical protein CONCODRAFT_68003 [Conidiobolus coronatus NRRL 28638]
MESNIFQSLNSQASYALKNQEIFDRKNSSDIDNGDSLAMQNLTKISDIQPGMTGLNLLGRVVNLTDINPHLVKGTMYGYYQSILIKDDTGLIAVRLYLREIIQINLDIVVLIKSTKCTFSKDSQSNQKNHYSFNNQKWLAVDKIMSDNSSIDIAEESKQILFKKPLGSKNDLVETMDMDFKINSTQADKTCKGKLLVVVQATQARESYNRQKKKLTKANILISNEYNKGMSLTLWNRMATLADSLVPYQTSNPYKLKPALLITNPTKTSYHNKLQVGLGSSSYIEVNPDCKNSRWILSFAQVLAESSKSIIQSSSIINNIKTKLEIDSIKYMENILSNINVTNVYKFEFVALVIELNVDNTLDTYSPLKWNCNNCGKSTRSNTQIYACPSCEESLNDSNLKFDLSKKLCFMDETASLYHPNILDEASNKLIGLMPVEFLRLTHGERVYLKVSRLFRQIKLLLQVSLNFNSQELEAVILDIS